MSSMTRSMQRKAMRRRVGSYKAFQTAWRKFKYPEVEVIQKDGKKVNTTKQKGRKRARRMDRSVSFAKKLSFYQRFLKAMRQKKNADKENKETK